MLQYFLGLGVKHQLKFPYGPVVGKKFLEHFQQDFFIFSARARTAFASSSENKSQIAGNVFFATKATNRTANPVNKPEPDTDRISSFISLSLLIS